MMKRWAIKIGEKTQEYAYSLKQAKKRRSELLAQRFWLYPDGDHYEERLWCPPEITIEEEALEDVPDNQML